MSDALPIPSVDSGACDHWSVTPLLFGDGSVAMYVCLDCRSKFEPVNVRLHEAAHETLHWLEGQQAHEDDDCGDPACRDCEPRRERQEAIDALRSALKAKR